MTSNSRSIRPAPKRVKSTCGGRLGPEETAGTAHDRRAVQPIARYGGAVQMPNRELAYAAPAVAREIKRNPTPTGDVLLARILEQLHHRNMVDVIELVRAILETETGPVGPAVRADPPES
jgi:hypothetical protein